LQEIFLTQDVAFWLREVAAAGIPCGPVQTIDQVFADPQVLARDMLWTIPHPSAGEVRLTGSPLKLSEASVTCRAHPPLLGEHTDEILTSMLNYSGAEVARLRAEGVV
ncbi:MAG TPA: CoA transferase, partial [Candidatus Binatia bacterium]|nr:CoA transferase [Candidatus Binatia bacterium]